MRLTEGQRAEVARHYGLIVWWSRRMARRLNRPGLEWDFAGECCVAACRAAGKFDAGRGGLAALVNEVCPKACLKYVRRLNAVKRGRDARTLAIGGSDPPAAGTDPARLAEVRDDAAAVLRPMDARRRQVACLWALGADAEETAAVLGLAEGYVHALRTRMRAAAFRAFPEMVPAGPRRRVREKAKKYRKPDGETEC